MLVNTFYQSWTYQISEIFFRKFLKFTAELSLVVLTLPEMHLGERVK